MGHGTIHRLRLCTFGFIAISIGLCLLRIPVVAQDTVDDRDYVGAGDCADCHDSLARDHRETAHALALQEVARNKRNVLGDFDQGAEIRTVQFPSEDAPRPFTADDIAFVIGAGRYVQRYAVEVERRVYAVLPAEWDTVNQEWRPYLLADTWRLPEYDFVQNCAGCHTTGLQAERGRWEDDGVQCEACHGPGSEHIDAADAAGRRPDDEEIAEIHAAIVLSPDPQICGQCHSQGREPALEGDSAHAFSTQYRPTKTLVTENGYQLVADDDPAAWYETGHGRLNNMQYNEWLHSAHATSLETLQASSQAEDGCVVCHSGDHAFMERILAVYEDGGLRGEPPAATTLDTAQYGVTCVTCHSPHAATEPALLVSTSYALCTSCHRNTELMPPVHHPVLEMFEGQPIIEGVDGIPSTHFTADERPTCQTCHMVGVPVDSSTILASHTWRPVIPGESEDSPPSACEGCHQNLLIGDLQSLVEDTQAAVRNRLLLARARVGSITIPEAGTAERDMYDRIATALTFVQNDGSLGVHNYAYTEALLNETSRLLSRLSVPGASLQPTEAPAPTATSSAPLPITVGMELPARTGLRPMTFVWLAVAFVILGGGSLLILRQAARKSRNQEKTE